MKALLLVDVQQDFFKGGALAVDKAENIISVINQVMPCFELVIASKDWHPKNHISFLLSPYNSSHQKKWPEHCVQNTQGSALHADLKKDYVKKIFYKGIFEKEDSYSAFYIGEHGQSTNLDEFLLSHGVKDLFIAGVVLEYCVQSTAEDALKKHYNVWLIEDAIASFSKESKEKILKDLQLKGAFITKSKELKI